MFHATCKAYELVLADGSVVWCDKDRHQKLFCSIPFSYGTLGFLAAVEINIVPFMPYLKQTYIPVSSLDEAVKVFETETKDESVDTVEGIMYSKDDGVIMSGKFEADIKVNMYLYCKNILVTVFGMKFRMDDQVDITF